MEGIKDFPLMHITGQCSLLLNFTFVVTAFYCQDVFAGITFGYILRTFRADYVLLHNCNL